MGDLLILNGSPRAPRSHSKHYAQMFSANYPGTTEYFDITKTNHQALCGKVGEYSKLLFVFPLYADAIPVSLLNFLKALEVQTPEKKPVVSVLINCGFLEPEQTRPAVEMVRFFCKRYGFPWGMALQIGSGEAILNTPFSFLVRRGLRRLAAGMRAGRSEVLSVRMFVWASGRYWTDYGAKNNITAGEMRTMEIEGG